MKKKGIVTMFLAGTLVFSNSASCQDFHLKFSRCIFPEKISQEKKVEKLILKSLEEAESDWLKIIRFLEKNPLKIPSIQIYSSDEIKISISSVIGWKEKSVRLEVKVEF